MDAKRVETISARVDAADADVPSTGRTVAACFHLVMDGGLLRTHLETAWRDWHAELALFKVAI